MRIVDGFIFYNELDILELRFKELDSVVDFFILVEATHTFTEKEKPLIFSENRQRFKKYLEKVIHIVVTDMPNNGNPWDNEGFQRNAINRGVAQLELDSKDLIMVTDCDEIPDSDRLREIKNGTLKIEGIVDTIKTEGIMGFNMDLYYYNFNTRGPNWTTKPYIAYREYFQQYSCDIMRYANKASIEKGGWHLSYFGTPEFIQNKLRTFSHQEMNIPANTDLENIQRKIKNKEGFVPLHHVDITEDSYLPKNYRVLL